jgi:hypothetical protein
MSGQLSLPENAEIIWSAELWDVWESKEKRTGYSTVEKTTDTKKINKNKKTKTWVETIDTAY